MTAEQFNKIQNELMEEELKMSQTKGKDYTIGNDDRLNNFKQVGQLVYCSHCSKPIGARAVFGVYLMKHILAILSWVKTGKVESEGLFGRFLDNRVYSTLGLAIAKEEEEKNKKEPVAKIEGYEFPKIPYKLYDNPFGGFRLK